MRSIFLLLIAITVGNSACKPTEPTTETGTLEIVFKSKYNNNTMPLYTSTATGTTPSNILLKKLEFFLSDIKGTNSKGSTVDFSDVEYISMNSSLDAASAEIGTTITISNVELGNYTQLDFGVGLSDAVNNTTPDAYETSSPLALNGNYWASWNSYILCKIEGDAIDNGNTSGFVYHSGVNGMHQLRSKTKSFDIQSGQTTQLVFHIDVEKIFFEQGATIDIVNENSTHSGAVGSTEYNLAQRIINNLANALSLQE